MAVELYPSSPAVPKPPPFQAIAAMAENRAIGNQGKIPWHLPEDFRWFKHKTMGGTLIMGRKTFESIGRPLPGRQTLVITHNRAPYDVPNCCDLASIDEALARLPAPYWVCGGTQIYTALLPSCAYLYLTRVKREVQGDAFFPEFESAFRLEGVIHETSDFRIECWLNPTTGWRSPSPLDPRPFAK